MYCPEDGTKAATHHDNYHPCYICPECGTHWTYDGDNAAYHTDACIGPDNEIAALPGYDVAPWAWD